MPRFSSVASLSNRGIRRRRSAGYVFPDPVFSYQRVLSHPGAPGYASNQTWFADADAMSINGSKLLAGDRNAWIGDRRNGRAWLFDLNSGSMLKQFDGQDTITYPDYFGWSVGLTPSRVFIGAPGEERSSGSTRPDNSGGIYSYTHTTTPNQGYDMFIEPTANTFAGKQIVVSKNGEPTYLYAPLPNWNSGIGKIVRIQASNFGATLSLNSPESINYGNFGSAAAASLSHVAIRGTDMSLVSPYNGSTKVYVYNSTLTSLLYTLTAPDPLSDTQYFGQNIQISPNGSYLAVSQLSSDTTIKGHIHIYNLSTGTLLRSIAAPTFFSSGGDWGGLKGLDISDQYVFVGATNLNNTERVDIFNISNGDLIQSVQNPDIIPSSGDGFGLGIKVTNTWLIVGARFEDYSEEYMPNVGKIYVYKII
jgi:hypothetical protein